MKSFSLASTVRSYPKLPYQKMKDDILGKQYTLSLVFIGAARAQALNKKHRKKSYVPDVLSFPITDTIGEIFITPEMAAREAKERGMSIRGYIGFLFIHGLLHLKGMRHGATMERAEKRYISKYKLK